MYTAVYLMFMSKMTAADQNVWDTQKSNRFICDYVMICIVIK